MKVRVQILLSLGIIALLWGLNYVGKGYPPWNNQNPPELNNRVKSANLPAPGPYDPTASSSPGVFRTFELSPGITRTWVDDASATYFRESRSIIVTTEPIQIEGSQRYGITLFPTFEVKSNIVTRPKKIAFLVESSREKVAGKTFSIRADGRTLVSSPLVVVDGESDDYVETTQVDVTYSVLEELSRAKGVKIMIGDNEADLLTGEIRRFEGITKIVESKLKF